MIEILYYTSKRILGEAIPPQSPILNHPSSTPSPCAPHAPSRSGVQPPFAEHPRGAAVSAPRGADIIPAEGPRRGQGRKRPGVRTLPFHLPSVFGGLCVSPQNALHLHVLFQPKSLSSQPDFRHQTPNIPPRHTPQPWRACPGPTLNPSFHSFWLNSNAM